MEKISLNRGWLCYQAGKREEAFDVDVPHDAMLLDPKSENSPGGVNNIHPRPAGSAAKGTWRLFRTEPDHHRRFSRRGWHRSPAGGGALGQRYDPALSRDRGSLRRPAGQRL